MIRVLKLGNFIYENFEPKTLMVKSFDENGIPVEFEERWTIPTDIEQLRNAVKDTLLWIARQKIFKAAEFQGYYSIGDLKFYADRGDTEAQELLEWYIQFETKIWNWIETKLPEKDFDELIQIDLYELVEQIKEE